MNKKIGTTLASFAAMTVVAACSVEGVDMGTMVSDAHLEVHDDGQAAFDQGKQNLASGYLGLALQQFRKALAQDPRSAPVLNALAVTYDRLGRHDIAELYFDRALAVDPGYSVALNNVGYSMLTRGRNEEALIYFEQALKKEPLARARQLIEANKRIAMDKLRLARRHGETVAVEKASLGGDRSPEGSDCPDANRHTVGRTGERVFTLITQPNDVSWPRVDGTIGDARHCGSAVRQYVAAVNTSVASNSPASARVHRLSTMESPLAAARSIAEARTDDDLPAESPAVSVATARSEQTPPVVAAKALTVEVSNGAGRNKLAARMRHYLEGKGLPVSFLTNAASFDNDRTTIFYKPGQRQAAERFAGLLPISVNLVETNENYADIRIRLGADILDFDKSVLYAANMGEPNA